MSADLRPEDKNIAQLARDTASDLSSIASHELRLATAEIEQNFERAAKAMREALVGAAMLLPALTVVLIAVGFGLGSIEGIADWVAFLIVGAVAAVAGFVMMNGGKKSLDPGSLLPKKAFRNLSKDAQAIKEAAQ